MDLLSRSAYIRQTLKFFRRSVPNNTFDITESLFEHLNVVEFVRDLDPKESQQKAIKSIILFE